LTFGEAGFHRFSDGVHVISADRLLAGLVYAAKAQKNSLYYLLSDTSSSLSGLKAHILFIISDFQQPKQAKMRYCVYYLSLPAV